MPPRSLNGRNTHMKKVLAAAGIGAAVLALTLSGCAVGEAADSPSNLQQELDHKADHMKENNDFLPAYLATLQGKQPFPKDRCYPRDLHDLLIPCDQP